MLAGPVATPFFHLENGLICPIHLPGQVEVIALNTLSEHLRKKVQIY